jgi:hypothetical protein
MRVGSMVAALMCAAAGVALAKLPALTAEEQQAAAAKRQKEQVQLEQEKKQLEKEQDRVAQEYKRTKGSGAGASGRTGNVSDHNMPKTTKELPGSAGPVGGKAQSAEAHSAPAK